jgi:hypothetical protein
MTFGQRGRSELVTGDALGVSRAAWGRAAGGDFDVAALSAAPDSFDYFERALSRGDGQWVVVRERSERRQAI